MLFTLSSEKLINKSSPLESILILGFNVVSWLGFLRYKIKKAIPHAQIVWYDSVITTGEVRWQSQLNAFNYFFLESCDDFFTDYHWKLPHLNESIQTAKTNQLNSLDVLFGTDIYGRGTYGGGGLQTYKALDEICKQALSISLFGIAFFYQNYNPEFEYYERKFWLDEEIDKLADFSGVEPNFLSVVKGWNLEGDWGFEEDIQHGKVFVSSKNWTNKTLQIDLEMLRKMYSSINRIPSTLRFSFFVKGKPSKVGNLYTIYIIGKSSEKNASKFLSNCNVFPNIKRATEKWQEIVINVDLKEFLDFKTLVIGYSGKDAEGRENHFGTCFTKEFVHLILTKDKDQFSHSLVKRMKYRRMGTSVPFGTFFNDGMGTQISFYGEKIHVNYCNFTDFDLCPTYLFQHKTLDDSEILKLFPDCTICDNKVYYSLNRELSYCGNTSYQIQFISSKISQIVVCKLFKTDFLISSIMSISSAIHTESSCKLFWIIKFNSNTFIKLPLEMSTIIEKWNISECKLNLPEKCRIKGIYLAIQTVQECFEVTLSLGHFSIFDPAIHIIDCEKQKLIEEDSIRCVIRSEEELKEEIVVNLEASWRYSNKQMKGLLYYASVFVNNIWVGNTINNYFFKNGIKLTSKDSPKVKILPVLLTGQRVSPIFLN